MANPTGMRYVDFAVRFEADGRGGYLATVLPTPGRVGGGGAAPFAPPCSAAELPRLLAELERTVRASGPGEPANTVPPRHVAPGTPESHGSDPETIGEALSKALFRDAVRDGYVSATAHADGGDFGIRLRLVFDFADAGIVGLAALPWELLRDPRKRAFLTLRSSRPMVRFLEVPDAVRLTDLEPPLRVLLVSAAPAHLPALHLEREGTAIVQELRGMPGVAVEWLPGATIAGLRDRVRRTRIHVLHFMGHAAFRERDGEGILYFEGGEADEPATLSGTQLDDLLDDVGGGPRLIVLNACDTARLPRRRGLDPYSGVATALVLGGAPAVVAMQFPISDRAAARFSHGLYRALAAGRPIEAAVTEGRQEIDRGHRGTLEWATPALYLRTTDGDVLKLRRGLARRRRGRLQAGAGGIAVAAILGTLLYLMSLWSPPLPPPYRRPAVPPVPDCPPPPGLSDLAFVRIAPGRLALPTDPDQPARELVVDHPFCLGAFEVTQRQWTAVLGAEANLSRFAGDDRPVERVSWDDAHAFLRRLNEHAGTERFRLPTDAEWEYAARAGTTTAYSFGDDPTALARYGNCLGREGIGDGFEATAPVGSFPPNPWGLYDLHGNVWEWVEGGVAAGEAPADAEAGRTRPIKRGGSHENRPELCRSEAWTDAEPGRRDGATGVRIVQEAQ